MWQETFDHKGITVCSANTIDTIHFLPSAQFNILSKEEI